MIWSLCGIVFYLNPTPGNDDGSFHHMYCVIDSICKIWSICLLISHQRIKYESDDRAHGIDHVLQCLCDILIIQIVSDSICMIHSLYSK